MKSPQRLLLLEDCTIDAEFLRRQLSAEWPDCEICHVNNKADFTAALKEGGFDLILADYILPGFQGPETLALAREHCPDVPFLFVSGVIGDEVAAKSLRAGATDYVLKDRLARLVPAIRRALNDVEESACRKQVEERLRQSDAEYRDLFENAMDLIQSVTPEGRFLYVNRAWRETLGYTEAEMVTLSFFVVLHPAHHESWRERLRSAKPDEIPWPSETIFLAKQGRHIYVEGNIGARFVSGKLMAARGIFHDVTEKKLATVALKRSIRQYEALVNSVDGIVWQANLPSLRFTFVSQQAERLLGYPVRCWLEEPDFLQNHIHPEDKGKAVTLRQQLTAEEQHQNFEYRMLAADGQVIWLRDIVSVRAEHGEAPQIQGIMVNITERKQAEEKLRRIQAKLVSANKDLSRRNREIQNFYHTLSHELKTPLTSAREFISIVMDGLGGPLNETQLKYLGIAKDSCNQLGVCINDLLDATRLETGKLALEMKPASLATLVQRVVTTMVPMATEKKIALRQGVQSDLPDVPLDESRMTQVVTNLLNNAIKYTPAGGEIVVKAGEAPGRPELLQVSVTDTGCGIPKEEQDHIFDRLYQIKSGDATTEQGVGLGLYLCRELVQLHGGNIGIESESGKGSTFFFVLPKSRQLLQANLLVIDDDPAMRDMLRQLLTAEPYNVRTACDGIEGLQEMRRQVPDIVLLDLAMPNLDGPATLKEIRKDWGQIPVIVHTAFADSDRMKQALAYSPFTLLAKPCPADQVLETVRKVQRSGDTAFWKRNHFGLEKPLLKWPGADPSAPGSFQPKTQTAIEL